MEQPPSLNLSFDFVPRAALVERGVESRTLTRLIREGRLRSRKVGRQVFLHVEDVRREFGFDQPDATGSGE